MDEAQLHALRRDPSPEFAEGLRDRLRGHDVAAPSRARWPLVRIAASAAVVAVVAGLFSVPAVRASAQSFLALFRVVNFVAVPVDFNRLDALKVQRLDPPHLIGDRLEVLEDGGPGTLVASPEQAGSVAGIDVRVPAYLPTSAFMARIEVKGQQRLRVTADSDRLRQAMDALGIRDLEVPEGLDGQVVTASIPPVVTIKYERAGSNPRSAQLMQARTPEVSLPSGVDLPALAEIGLRILGLPRIEARDFAQSIDWQTTMLVPVPPWAVEFKQVEIGGQRGVVITGAPGQGTNMVLWSGQGRVFGIEGTFTTEDLLRMANSLE